MTVIIAAGSSAATIETIKQKAKRLSILSIMSTTAAGSGHPISCMSAGELVAGTAHRIPLLFLLIVHLGPQFDEKLNALAESECATC